MAEGLDCMTLPLALKLCTIVAVNERAQVVRRDTTLFSRSQSRPEQCRPRLRPREEGCVSSDYLRSLVDRHNGAQFERQRQGHAVQLFRHPMLSTLAVW